MILGMEKTSKISNSFRTCCSVSRISSIKYCRRLSFGQLLFMSINKIIGIKQPNLSDYPFDSLAMIITLSLLLALMFYYSL